MYIINIYDNDDDDADDEDCVTYIIHHLLYEETDCVTQSTFLTL